MDVIGTRLYDGTNIPPQIRKICGEDGWPDQCRVDWSAKKQGLFSLQTYGVPTGTVAGTVVGFSVAALGTTATGTATFVPRLTANS